MEGKFSIRAMKKPLSLVKSMDQDVYKCFILPLVFVT